MSAAHTGQTCCYRYSHFATQFLSTAQLIIRSTCHVCLQFLALVPLQLVEWVSRDKRKSIETHNSTKQAVRSQSVSKSLIFALYQLFSSSVFNRFGQSDLDCLLFRCCLTYSEASALADERHFDLHLYLASAKGDHTR